MKIITANKLNRLWENGIIAKMVGKSRVLNTTEEVSANTNAENVTGALAAKEIINDLVSNVYVGTDGKIHVVKGGADTGLNFSNVISALTKLNFKAVTRVNSISVTNGKHYLIACIITCDAVTPAPDASLVLSGCTTLAVSGGACGVYSSGRMKLFFVKATSTTIAAKQTGGYIYAQID